ncbi:MAG: TIM-barrel domain-containing protein [Lachnospiraceae bacterium]|jgi:glycoside hydrolase family 31 gh31D
MVKKYVYGRPFETYAVVNAENVSDAAESEKREFFREADMKKALEPYGGITWDEPEDGNDAPAMQYRVRMSDGDVVYGLGENVRGINKRGWVYESKCSDDPNHTESKRSLYGAHNFIIIADADNPAASKGLFIDYPGRVIFDIGYLDKNELVITVCSGNFTAYVVSPAMDGADGSDNHLYSIVRQFRHIIGKSYVPPRWAFGYQQCRWSYMSADEVCGVVDSYRKRNIPIDAVYLDIDYMERYKDFTVNKETFPDFADFVKKMREKHIHLVPIIDAGVKIEDGYDTYEEGRKNGYFCKEADGEDFVAGVWPGRVHFPDVLNEDARRWFGHGYKVLLDAGIDGFWNDMNEPAIFYSEKHLKEVFDKIDDYKGKNLDIQSFFEFKGMVEGVANNLGDYERFYHRATQPDGEAVVRHDHVHNLYGFNMTRAASESFKELVPDKDILMFSRASYIGMHRYGGIWTGDNHAWWSHILLSLKMLPSLNMCGFMYVGSDVGGFNDNTTEELLMRWMGLAVFVPLMRNHAAAGTRYQELYRFTDTDTFKNIVTMRYALIPYLWEAYRKAVEQDTLMYRPLGFEHPEDKVAVATEDQLYVGEDIMICPVYTQNAVGRYVYLPEPMTMVRMKSADEYELEKYEAGHYFVEIPAQEIVFFIRDGHRIPLYKSAEYTEAVFENECEWIGE